MSNRPFFSVVIPTFNCAPLLKRALKSVEIQTFSNYEIIIIDNSSTDETKSVVENSNLPRLKFENINNKGIIAKSRNKGIELSKGKWISFLDSDDVWLPRKLEKVERAIKNNKDCIAICHHEWHVVNNKRVAKLIYGPNGEDLYSHLLFKGNCMSTSAVSISKDILIKTNGFSTNQDFVTVEDYEYWIRLSKEGKTVFLDEILGEWHTHKNNYSGNIDIHISSGIAVSEHHLRQYIRDESKNERKIKGPLSRVYANASRGYQKYGKFADSYSYAIKSIRTNFFQLKAWVVLLLTLVRSSR